MEIIKISRVTSADINQLQAIGRKTFVEAFADQNSEQDIQTYLDKNLSISELSKELNNINSAFYFATLDNKIIGYLKINFGQAQTELKEKSTLEIERIYVLQEFHGKKVGQALLKKAIDIANSSAKEYVWLGVWEKNLRAIHFYKKNGFIEFDKHIFKLGNDEQTDIMMRLKLK
jgi:ribosomal protein S18 acetylase RimI-like enzyme